MDQPTSEQITAWATVGLGAATYWLGRTTRGALKAAQQDTREATKARIDARAPQVAVVATAPLPPRAAWMVAIESPAVSWNESLHGGARIALAGWFRMKNEGRGTAMIEVPADVVVVTPGESSHRLMEHVAERRPTGSYLPLEPGESRNLYVEAGMTLAEWVDVARAKAGSWFMSVSIRVDDLFLDGVRDVIDLQLCGMPIVSTDTHDLWKSDVTPAELIVSGTRRSYAGAGTEASFYRPT